MSTIRQLIWIKKKKKARFVFSKSLNRNPFVRGRFLKRVVITPRKPNSALRKCGRVKLVNNKLVFTKIPGSELIPLKFATVLVRGKGHKDTPSVKYSIVRGSYDCLTFLEKIRKRSKYQVPSPFLLREKRKKKKMFQQESLITILLISILPIILFYLYTFLLIFFSKNIINFTSREVYECGFKGINENIDVLDIHFYIVGIIFLIFEMEIILFVPFFLNIKGINFFFFFIIFFFFFIILFSFVYEWDKYGINFSF